MPGAILALAFAAQALACVPAPQLGEQIALFSKASLGVPPLLFRLDPEAPAIGSLVRLHLRWCDPSEPAIQAQIRVDASMPAHGHGMNYRPPMVELSEGHATVDGIVFHMPGTWRLQFVLRHGERTLRAHAEIVLQN
jgi:hypothetical protein